MSNLQVLMVFSLTRMLLTLIFLTLAIASKMSNEEYEKWRNGDKLELWEKPFEPLDELLPIENEAADSYKFVIKEVFEKNYPKNFRLPITIRIILAAHMKAIKISDAIKLIRYVSDVELRFEDNFRIYANAFGDNLIAMEVFEKKLGAKNEKFETYYKEWTLDKLFSQEGVDVIAYTRLLIIATEKCFYGKEVVCDVEMQMFWKHLATFTATACLLRTTQGSSSKLMLDVFYDWIEEGDMGGSLFYSGYNTKGDAHAMLVHAWRLDNDNLLVKVFETGFAKYGKPFKKGKIVPKDAFFDFSHELLVYKPTSKSEIYELLPNYFYVESTEKLTEDQQERLLDEIYGLGKEFTGMEATSFKNPWQFARVQKAGTCMLTVLWTWLRYQGPEGMRLEIYLKGKLLEELKSINNVIRDIVSKIEDPEQLPVNLTPYLDYLKVNAKPGDKQVEILTELEKIEKNSGFEMLRTSPSIYSSLVSSGINEVLEYLAWITSNEDYKESGCYLYEEILNNLIKPFKDDTEIQGKIADPLTLIARRCKEKLPYYFELEKIKTAIKKASALSQLKLLCNKESTLSLACYEKVRETFGQPILMQRPAILEYIGVIENVWKRGDYLTPAMAYLLKYKVPKSYKSKLPYIFKQGDAFKLSKYKNQKEYEAQINKCADPKTFKFFNAEEWATCRKLYELMSSLDEPYKLPKMLLDHEPISI